MNRKIALLTALSLIAGTALCACGSDKKENKNSSISSSADESSESKSDKTGSREEKNVFAEYLKKQKTCSISKGFKILEPGTARENPNGLAGAVKYDFDGDGDEELVTLTFDRNSKNAEDLRIDLVKEGSAGASVADSKYLTEFLDLDNLYNEKKQDTLYFSGRTTLQIVTSEYNGRMYIGCILSEAPEIGRMDYKYSTYSVLTIEDDEIISQSAGVYNFGGLFTEAYSKILPPGIKEIDNVNKESELEKNKDCNIKGIEDEFKHTVDAGKYLIYAAMTGGEKKDNYKLGAYSAPETGLSDMLNEFGLDISPDIKGGLGAFVSKNHSEMKVILQLTQIKPLDASVYEYVGCKLELSSDLEKLIGNDSPFYEPFRDETDVYTDILRYPYYYPEVFEPLLKGNSSANDFEYFVADINGDGKKELEINLPNDEIMQGTNGLVIVFPDLTVRNPDGGNIEFSDNGMLNINTFTGARHIVYNLDTGCSHAYYGMDGSEHTMDADGNELTGSAAEKVSADMKAKKKGSRIYPEYQSFSLKDGLKGDIVFTEDVSTLRMTWQKAYIYGIDKYINESTGGSSNTPECALIYIDDDEIPELYLSYFNDINVYTFDDDLVLFSEGGIRNNGLVDYKEKKGIFVTHSSGSMYDTTMRVYELKNFKSNLLKEFVYNKNAVTEEVTYTIDGKNVTEDEYKKQLAEYDYGTEISELYSADDMKKLLSGDTSVKPIKNSDSGRTDSGSTATVTSDDGLRMRKGAGLQYDVITVIPYKAEVEKIETQGDWVKVKYKNDTGWVSKEFLK